MTSQRKLFKKKHKLKIHYKKGRSFIYWKDQTSVSGTGSIVSKDYSILTFRQQKLLLMILRKEFNKKNNVILRINTSLLKTKKPLASRIGKGKGNISFFYAQIFPGTVLCDVSNVTSKQLIRFSSVLSKLLKFKVYSVYDYNIFI